VRTSGDLESRKGVDRVFTDRVILDVPIVTMGPGGGPVIDMDALLVGQSSKFFGFMTAMANTRLARIAKAKAFPKNVELAFELPLAGGRFGTLHYSLSALPENTGYKPRVADGRVGYFTTTYMDLGKPGEDTPWIRKANRWKLEKADSKLRLSPPKEPIVFYLEHTIPVRYRRWVRDGVLEWNKAFEKVGISNAIEVYQQDARTGAHMDKDPEDARYNFVLWTNSNMGFAIGPSRVDPRTGQILDADIVMDEGFISGWVRQWKKMIPEVVMRNFGPDTLDWLAMHPSWDPRVRLADTAEQPAIMTQIAQHHARHAGVPYASHPAALADPALLGDDQYDGLAGRVSQVNGSCAYAMQMGAEVALLKLTHVMLDEIAAGEIDRPKAQDAMPDPVSGLWEGDAEVPEMGPMPFTMNLLLGEENMVTGDFSGGPFMADVAGSWAPDSKKLDLRAELAPDLIISFDLTIENDEMTGTAADAEGSAVQIRANRTSTLETDVDEGVSVGDDEDEDSDDDDADEDEDSDDDDADDDDDDADDDDDGDDEDAEDEDATPAAKDSLEQILDGVPERFIGPLLKGVIIHEVGHTLGLRHNFKSSTVYSLEEINSEEHKGKPIVGSVMEYTPININFESGEVQGEYAMMTLGPYDYWAIEYGYTFDKKLEPILKRATEPELAYGTDEDSFGSDPTIRVFDLGDNSIDYADSQMRLVNHLRESLLERMVKDGDSWGKAREGYEMLLYRQVGAVSTAASWVGGSRTNRFKKGDSPDVPPVRPVTADQQRRAMAFVIENTFRDEAFGLTPELLSKMTIEKWWDAGGMSSVFEDPAWPVHQRIMGIQASALTMLMNPGTLSRVYDNEFMVDADEDALTIPELMTSIHDEIWSELDHAGKKKHTARKPMVSSLRRNLQREHVDRLIDLTLPKSQLGAASNPVANLATWQLRQLQATIEKKLKKHGDRIDPYTVAHLADAQMRIEAALDADYIYNTNDLKGGGGGMPFILLQEGVQPPSN
jgi:hypothetical protein